MQKSLYSSSALECKKLFETTKITKRHTADFVLHLQSELLQEHKEKQNKQSLSCAP